MDFFNPVGGLIGGACIGLGASTLLLFNGDILGCSGLLSSITMTPGKISSDPRQHWKLVLVSSFTLTASFLFGPEATYDARLYDKDSGVPIVSTLGYIIGGLLVGLGTKLANGCTSGHGVCGLARFSRRSLAAVVAFMGSGMVTVYLTHPQAPWALYTAFLRASEVGETNLSYGVQYVTAPLLLAAIIAPSLSKEEPRKVDHRKLIPAAVSGALFAAGLAIGQMTLHSTLFGFLNITGIVDRTWDPTLAVVMGSAVTISAIAYQFVDGFNLFKNPKAMKRPSQADKFSIPDNQTIDSGLILGSIIFGAGWAIATLCPGPAMFSAAVGEKAVLYYWGPAYMAGAYLGEYIKG